MHTEHHTLPPTAPGTQRHWLSLHFGEGRNGRKTVIQCALHADEIPGLLVGVHLRRALMQLEGRGAIEGEIVLVPMANPIGLSQEVSGSPVGRFELGSGLNFNRGYRHLTPDLRAMLQGRLGGDEQANTRVIRAAAAKCLQAQEPGSEADALKLGLQRLAIDADIVLDLHSDSEALLHLYAPTPHEETALLLARRLHAQPVLLAVDSGGDPFDESVARHWWELRAEADAGTPVALACFSCTIELRGEADVSHELAARDALGLLGFLEDRGHLRAGALASLEGHDAGAFSGAEQDAGLLVTGLDAVDPITAPCGGVLVMLKRLGQMVQAGEVVAEVIDPLTGQATPLKSRTEGLLFAHRAQRQVFRGTRVAKVAGRQAIRSGHLLSP